MDPRYGIRRDWPEVEVNGDFNRAVREFRNRLNRSGIFAELKRRKEGISKSGRKKVKRRRAELRRRKEAAREEKVLRVGHRQIPTFRIER